MFFESKRCQADGKYVFISTQGITSSINRFQSSQSIQSMMIGENRDYARHPVSITQECPAHYEHSSVGNTELSLTGTEFDAADDVGWESNEVPTLNGGMSSNWFDDISGG
ncbi:unnamed protein product [Phytophthora fragariaefolia]|uniref:Unnamed protein product n=1 Tax=Phytophthora fragariaefolia TaxID=1490495 RepID=A0A9W6U1L9_9STRA|nr:unnamed protein product [Phytophthora fragariaefolia]